MVIGLGVSGRAAARFLSARGAGLVLTDQRETLDGRQLAAGRNSISAREDPAWLEGVDLVVASPGVPPTSTLLRAARAAAFR